MNCIFFGCYGHDWIDKGGDDDDGDGDGDDSVVLIVALPLL